MSEHTVTYHVVIDSASAVKALSKLQTQINGFKHIQQTFAKINQSANNLQQRLASLTTKEFVLQVRTGTVQKRLLEVAEAANAAKAALAGLPANVNLGAVGAAGKGGTKTQAGKAGTSRAASSSTAVGAAAGMGAATSRARGTSNAQAASRAARQARVSQQPVTSLPTVMPAGTAFQTKPARAARTTRQARVPKTSVAPSASSSGTRYIGSTVLGATNLNAADLGVTSMLKGMGIMYGLTGVGSAISSAMSDYMNYENTMTTTRAILSTHDKRMNFGGRFQNMEKVARRIGMRTKYTAPEVADATKFLAMAGMNIEDINRSMPTIANMALVADEDIGNVADLTTNILTAYRMPTSNITKMADIMTMGFTMSNTTLPEMAEAFKYFASFGAANDLDFAELTAMVGLLGDAGIKGSHAGTTIRMILANMLKPTKTQKKAWASLGVNPLTEDGKTRSMIDVFSELAEKNAMTKAFNLFRVTASQGATSLIQDQLSTGKWQRMVEQMRQSDGITETLANTRINNLEGMWAQVKSVFTEITMRVFEGMVPQLKGIMDKVIYWLQTPEAFELIKNISSAIFNLLQSIGTITTYFVEIYNKFSGIINFWMKFQLIVSAVMVPLRIIAGLFNSIVGIGSAAKSLGQFIMRLTQSMNLIGSGNLKGAANVWTAPISNGGSGAAPGSSGVPGTMMPSASAGKGGNTMSPLMPMSTGLGQSFKNHAADTRDFYEKQFFSDKKRDQLANLRRTIAYADARMKLPMAENARAMLQQSRTNAWNEINSMYKNAAPLYKAKRLLDLSRVQYQHAVQRQFDAGQMARYEAWRYAPFKEQMDALQAQRAAILREQSEKGSTHSLDRRLRRVDRQINALAPAWSVATAKYHQAQNELPKANAELTKRRRDLIDARKQMNRVNHTWERMDQARSKAGYGIPGALANPNRVWSNVPITGPLTYAPGAPLVPSPRPLPPVSRWQQFKGGVGAFGKLIYNGLTSPTGIGLMSMGAGMIGGTMGAQAGGIGGAVAGSLWGTALPAMIGAGPVGWIAAAVTGLAGVGFWIHHINEEAEKGRAIVKRWGDNLRIDGRGFFRGTEATDMMNFQRLISDSYMSQNDQLSIRVSLLQKAYDLEAAMAKEKAGKEAQAGLTGNIQTAYEEFKNGLTFYDGAKQARDLLDEAWRGMFGQNLLNGHRHTGGITYTDALGNTHKWYSSFMTENEAATIASLGRAAKDYQPTKDIMKEWEDKLTEYALAGDIWGAKGVLETAIGTQAAQYHGIPTRLMPANLPNADELSGEDILNSYWFRDATAKLMNPSINSLKERFTALQAWEKAKESGKYTVADLQNYLLATGNMSIQSIFDYNPQDQSKFYQGIGRNPKTGAWTSREFIDHITGISTVLSGAGAAELFMKESESVKALVETLKMGESPEIKQLLEFYNGEAKRAKDYRANGTLAPLEHMDLSPTPANTLWPMGNTGGGTWQYKSDYFNKKGVPQQNVTAFNLGGWHNITVNGRLDANDIKGIQELVDQAIRSTLQGAQSQLGSGDLLRINT